MNSKTLAQTSLRVHFSIASLLEGQAWYVFQNICVEDQIVAKSNTCNSRSKAWLQIVLPGFDCPKSTNYAEQPVQLIIRNGNKTHVKCKLTERSHKSLSKATANV